ncbi:unnamed protein product [Effrenium voratum]|nr:unnamed protein product [Effrenium voratum]
MGTQGTQMIVAASLCHIIQTHAQVHPRHSHSAFQSRCSSAANAHNMLPGTCCKDERTCARIICHPSSPVSHQAQTAVDCLLLVISCNVSSNILAITNPWTFQKVLLGSCAGLLS